jgi:hypothetical protein
MTKYETRVAELARSLLDKKLDKADRKLAHKLSLLKKKKSKTDKTKKVRASNEKRHKEYQDVLKEYQAFNLSEPKQCVKCKLEKPSSEFPTYPNENNYRRVCGPCYDTFLSSL